MIDSYDNCFSFAWKTEENQFLARLFLQLGPSFLFCFYSRPERKPKLAHWLKDRKLSQAREITNACFLVKRCKKKKPSSLNIASWRMHLGSRRGSFSEWFPDVGGVVKTAHYHQSPEWHHLWRSRRKVKKDPHTCTTGLFQEEIYPEWWVQLHRHTRRHKRTT